MLHDTPLRNHHESYAAREAQRETDAAVAESRPGAATGRKTLGSAAEYITYGPPDDTGLVTCEILATFGAVEAEYAAIQRAAGLLDCPHRGTLRVRGADRVDFLDRMVTQKLEGLAAGETRAAFWLNRKGRIEADLFIVELGDEMLIDVDVHQAASTAEAIASFVFTEDVQVDDRSGAVHRIAVHGPRAAEVCAVVCEASPSFSADDPDRAGRVSMAGVDVVVAPHAQTGGPGFELFMPYDDAPAVWDALLTVDDRIADGRRRIRPTGWYAYNVARIEGGTPLFNIDFGPTNIPHETGVLAERVSFTKGCYPGQEVVARIQSLGKPKQILVGLKVAEDRLPVAGAQVFEKTEDGFGEQVGVVTSSTISPLLGAQPIAFAMIRSAHAASGTTLIVNAEGGQADAVVGATRFVAPAERQST